MGETIDNSKHNVGSKTFVNDTSAGKSVMASNFGYKNYWWCSDQFTGKWYCPKQFRLRILSIFDEAVLEAKCIAAPVSNKIILWCIWAACIPFIEEAMYSPISSVFYRAWVERCTPFPARCIFLNNYEIQGRYWGRTTRGGGWGASLYFAKSWNFRSLCILKRTYLKKYIRLKLHIFSYYVYWCWKMTWNLVISHFLIRLVCWKVIEKIKCSTQHCKCITSSHSMQCVIL